MFRRVFFHFGFAIFFLIACVAADKHTSVAELVALVLS